MYYVLNAGHEYGLILVNVIFSSIVLLTRELGGFNNVNFSPLISSTLIVYIFKQSFGSEYLGYNFYYLKSQ